MKGYELYTAIAYLILGPFIGGLLDGIGRKITARLQGRVGPPIIQPFYDLRKLFSRKLDPVNRIQMPLVLSHLIFAIMTGFLIFEGSDILLIIFVLTLAGIFLVLAAYSTGSPYGTIGADRELIMMTAYEPMVILTLVGLYKVAGSFHFGDIAAVGKPTVLFLPGIFLGLAYILPMKLRKSPFDISTSHHAHQELVKGLTADLGGPALGMVELAHWYECVYLYGLVFLFFAWNPIAAVIGPTVTFLAIILIDNVTARVKWELALTSAWIVALVAGVGNLIPFYLITRGLH
ncbi:MAG TPA: NADH-quinone oxidoreductase subunit H [Rectinemataceae bacterium]|nr:NADH-quinone oxidoreductase subunit H [Rectinemataceae bacterium]